MEKLTLIDNDIDINQKCLLQFYQKSYPDKKTKWCKNPIEVKFELFKVTLRTMKFIKLLTLYLKFPQPSVPYCWMTGSYFFDFTSSEKNTIFWNLFYCRILKLILFFHEINILVAYNSIWNILTILVSAPVWILG